MKQTNEYTKKKPTKRGIKKQSEKTYLKTQLLKLKKEVAGKKILINQKKIDNLQSLLKSINNDYELSVSGKTICDLFTSKNVYAGDKFIVTHKDTEINQLQSKSITYKDITDNIRNTISSNLNIGSISFQPTYRYAKYNHTHSERYNHLSVENNMKDYVGNVYNVAKIIVDDLCGITETYIQVPALTVFDTETTEVGTLKFIANYQKFNSINNEYINNINFNGWVYPDGSEFTLLDTIRFKEAISKYGTSSNTIKVPLLDDFFKCSPKKTKSFNKKEQQIGIEEHYHDVNDNITINFKPQIRITDNIKNYTTKDANNQQNIYNFGYKYSDTTKTKTVPFTISFNNIQLSAITKQNILEGEKFEPKHNRIPVMIYIGGVIS